MAKVYVTSLTSDAIAYLNDRENVVVHSSSSKSALVMTAGGVVIACLIALLTYDYRWSSIKLAVLGCLVLPASYLIVAGVRKWILGRARLLTPGLVITRDHAVFVDDEDIEWLPITDLINADYRHQFNGRTYEYSTLSVSFPQAVRKYRVDGVGRVEATVDEIHERRRLSLVRANRSDETVNCILDTIPVIRGRFRLRSLIPTVLLTLIVGSIGTFGAILLNEYFQDQLSWQAAAETDTAASYRQYLRTNPIGRRSVEAAGRLKAFYDNAESRYKESLKPGFDQAAVDSILALLRSARETHVYQVKVSFERFADIPSDLIEQLKADFEVKTVLPLGNTFTDERMIEREGQLFGVLQSSFKQIFPNDVLELVSECAGECATLNVRYSTSFLNTIYYDLKEKEIPEADRNWSPGILIEWTCSFTIPGQVQSYSFELESAPADSITYDTVETVGSDRAEADQNSFYDAMVASSFDDFRAHLLFNLGLGPDPHPGDENPNVDSPEAPVRR